MDHILRQNPVIVSDHHISCTSCGHMEVRPATWRDQSLDQWKIIPVRAA